MQMSDDEIKVSYQQAKNQTAQVDILADLNGTSKDAMVAKLESLGLTVPPRASKPGLRTFTFDAARALELYRGGQSDQDIAKHLGIHTSTFAAWRRGQGLKANRPKPLVKKPATVASPERMTARRLAEIFRQIAERYPDVAVRAGGGEVTRVDLLSAFGPGGEPVLEVCMRCGGAEEGGGR